MSTHDGFYGVYLLVSLNPHYKGCTYIGFTVDPARRLHQHNRGSHAGGAFKTSSKGPWSMVLITHGFPNEVAALRLEWAWQHPQHSRILKPCNPRKKSSESRLHYALRLLALLLSSAPWCALPLTVVWLDQQYHAPFPEGLEPAVHMPITFCSVTEVKKSLQDDLDSEDEDNDEDHEHGSRLCSLCSLPMNKDDCLKCSHKGCRLISHVVCLGQHLVLHPTHPHPTQHLTQPFGTHSTTTQSIQTTTGAKTTKSTSTKGGKSSKTTTTGHHEPTKSTKNARKNVSHEPARPLLPVEGYCPLCDGPLLWGQLVRPLSTACAGSRGSNKGRGVWEGPDSGVGGGLNSEVGSGTSGTEAEICEVGQYIEETDEESDDDHWTNILTQQN